MTFAVPFCTRPDSGEDDYVLVIGLSFAFTAHPLVHGPSDGRHYPQPAYARGSGRRAATVRARLAYDGRLLGAVSRIFVDSVLGWYRRRMALEGATRGQSGWP